MRYFHFLSLYILREALKIATAGFTMPLLTDLPAGSTYEGHRHGAAYGTDLFGVRGLAIGTDDTLAASEVLLELLVFFDAVKFCFTLYFFLLTCSLFILFLFIYFFLYFFLHEDSLNTT